MFARLAPSEFITFFVLISSYQTRQIWDREKSVEEMAGQTPVAAAAMTQLKSLVITVSFLSSVFCSQELTMFGRSTRVMK